MQGVGNSLDGSLGATVPATDQWVQCDRYDARFLSVGHCQDDPSGLASFHSIPVQPRFPAGWHIPISLCPWWLAESHIAIVTTVAQV